MGFYCWKWKNYFLELQIFGQMFFYLLPFLNNVHILYISAELPSEITKIWFLRKNVTRILMEIPCMFRSQIDGSLVQIDVNFHVYCTSFSQVLFVFRAQAWHGFCTSSSHGISMAFAKKMMRFLSDLIPFSTKFRSKRLEKILVTFFRGLSRLCKNSLSCVEMEINNVKLSLRVFTAFNLADAGYDVWINNIRGTAPSQGHVNLTTNDEAYWDFS